MEIETQQFEQFYDVFEDIGKGQFAVVRRCVERSTGHQYAAKFVRKRRVCRGVAPEDIEREVELLKQLKGHPHIVNLHGAFDSRQQAVLVLELIEGGELFHLVAERERLEEREAAYCVKQILLALDHMHSQQIVHLDLKPENILLLDREALHIKLIDFGLSQVLNPEIRLRAMFGTPEFVPPEVVNYEPLTLSADMWSVGVITYILVSGASPFLGDDKQETFANVVTGSYSFDDEFFSGVSDMAKDFISKLLVKEPSKRETASNCLKHPWLQEDNLLPLPVTEIKNKRQNIRNIKARRQWKHCFQAVKICLKLQSNCGNYTFTKGDNFAMLALHCSAVDGNADGLEELLSIANVDVNISNKHGVTAAHVAAGQGQLSILTLLKSRGANFLAADCHGDTPLIWAAQHGQAEALAWLLEAGVPVSAQNQDGNTALHHAASRGHVPCLKLLANAGCFLDQPNAAGRTALHMALSNHQIQCGMLLLHSGADVDLQDLAGDGPIHIASQEGLLVIAQTLCAFGCNVDVSNCEGLFPLHLAARNGHTEVVRCLCLAGCNIEQRNADGIKAEITALKHGYNEIGDLLGRLKNKEEYIRQLIPTSQPPNRFIVKFLGHSGVGKTTLIESLKAGYFSSLFRKTKSSSNNSSGGATSPGSKTQIEMDVTSSRSSLSFDTYNYLYTRGIDIQQVSVSGPGDLTIWEFSGQDTYFQLYHHFLGSTSCLHIVVFSLEDPPSLQLQQCCFWLSFLQSRTPPAEPLGEGGIARHLPLVQLVATHNDTAGLYASSQAHRVLSQLQARFGLHLELIPQVVILDSHIPNSNGMRQLKSCITRSKQRILQEVPRWTGFLEGVTSWLTSARRNISFPVLFWPSFVAAVRTHVNPLAGEEHMRELLQQLCLTGEVIHLRSPYYDDMVCINPRWLGGTVIGQLLSLDFVAQARVTGCYTAHDFQAAFPECAALELLPVLEALQLCTQCENDGEVEYEFPCYNFIETLDGLWDSTDPRYSSQDSCYGGVRLKSPTGTFHLIHSIFPRLQVQLRRAAQVLADPDTDLYQWFEGSKLCAGPIESLATLEEDGESMEIKVRGPPGAQIACFYFLEELLGIVDQVLMDVCPGLPLEKHVMSAEQLKKHSSKVYCWPPDELMKAILKPPHLESKLLNPLTKNSECVLDLIGFKSPEVMDIVITGDELPVAALSTVCRQQLCRLLDPPDPMGRDWCLLAVKLGLSDRIATLDCGETSHTARLLDEWGSSVGTLISTLQDLGREDAADILLRNAPLYRIVPMDVQESPPSKSSCSNLSR